jgi:hypothetical protein
MAAIPTEAGRNGFWRFGRVSFCFAGVNQLQAVTLQNALDPVGQSFYIP